MSVCRNRDYKTTHYVQNMNSDLKCLVPVLSCNSFWCQVTRISTVLTTSHTSNAISSEDDFSVLSKRRTIRMYLQLDAKFGIQAPDFLINIA